ncbi:16S rRNA (cytosine(1402)-N(4))-methyltransferase [Candidatus Poribacteria bacterium]|nr:MAG: 16S rRNA (cytosine(1402)-N(4))-methyltransferase [Candidatus Poribacteria bacterium]
MGFSYDELHIPVMAEEVLKLLNPRSGGIYVDCTLGAGGHAERILEASKPDGLLIGIDMDESALKVAGERLKRFGERVKLIHANFAELDRILDELEIGEVDGVLMDLGVSWMQLSDPERGFSFQVDGPLDMRMDRRNPVTAMKVVNELSEEELRRIIREYGEERYAGRIARKIVSMREIAPITTTGQLARVIESAVPPKARRGRIHPATRTFQAIRIYVNRELENLERGLKSAIERLRPGGRICVISFHSLEDRIVKRTLKSSPELKVLTKKPLRPSEEEIKRNPRSRSAKLRAAEATSTDSGGGKEVGG